MTQTTTRTKEAGASRHINPEIEATIIGHLDLGDHPAAVAAALRGYGRVLLADLRRRLPDREAARDAFGELARQMLEEVGGFRREASFLTWARVIGRNLARRLCERQGRQVVLSTSGFTRLAERRLCHDPLREPTETSPYAASAPRDRLRAARAQLGEADQRLLQQRYEEGLTFAAQGRGEHGAEGGGSALAARQRKRGSRAYQRLRRLLQRDGQGRISALLDALPVAERRLVELRQIGRMPWPLVASRLQEEGHSIGPAETLPGHLRRVMAALLGACRQKGLLPRELFEVGLLGQEDLPAAGPAPRRRPARRKG